MTPRSPRTRVRRDSEKACYDREALYAVLDTAPLCHLGYIHEGVPFVTPTLQWREGDFVYWHGSSASRAINQALEQTICLTVTRLDGLVLARSAFHHSVNYASAMIFGEPESVTDPCQKKQHLERFMETLVPDRWSELRRVTAQELKATAVLRMPLEEASVKMRSGDPEEGDADRALPIWAGVIPVAWQSGTPIPCPYNAQDLELPEYLDGYQLGGT